MTNRVPIRLVLDTSAVLAYAAGSFDLGETMAEVVEEGARFAVPAICLAEASRLAEDDHRAGVLLLTRHTSAVVLPLGADDWQSLGAAASVLGRIDLAAALLTALRADAIVATAEPARYDPEGTGHLPVIGV